MAIVLKRLSDESTWEAIETELTGKTIRIYNLPNSPVRMDATTMSGYHLVSEEGLFQWGHSKDDPTLAQIKVMMASLDPLGMPTATHVVSGESADDGLYIPIFDQVRETLGTSGLLWVGDCKMSASETRAHIHLQKHYYLTPLARVGQVPEQLLKWLEQTQQENWSLIQVKQTDEKGATQVIASGYELERSCSLRQDKQVVDWTERVKILHSQVYEKQQQRGLEQRLQRATDQLIALTPPVGKGLAESPG